MALRATSFESDPRETTLPGDVVFTATLIDRTATAPVQREVHLALVESNDLVFSDGTKTSFKKVKVGSSAVTVEFKERIKGTAGERVSFRVSLDDENDKELDFRFIRIV